MARGSQREGALRRCSRTEGVVVRSIAGETLLVPTSGELAQLQRLFVLDEVGEFVWEQLEETADLAAVVQRVTEEFDVSLEVAAADLDEFVAALTDAGLVTVETGEK